jgi:hypothetical protein
MFHNSRQYEKSLTTFVWGAGFIQADAASNYKKLSNKYVVH